VLFGRIKALMADQGLHLSTTVYDDLIDPLQARVAQLEVICNTHSVDWKSILMTGFCTHSLT
jgi:hypothetical protein